MRKFLRFLPAVVAAALPLVLMTCGSSNPTNPFVSGTRPSTGGTSGTATTTVTITATRYDVSADGVDSVVVTAKVLDEQGRPVVNGQILWSLSTQNYSGSPGRTSSSTSVTNGSGNASVGYIAPSLDFVGVGYGVVVSGTFSIAGNPQGSPRGAVTLLLRPKGTAPTTGTGPTGQPISPVITAVTPNLIKVDANPAITVIIQGTGFDGSSQVIIVTSQGLEIVTAEVLSAEQIRFTVPSTLAKKAGDATLFVTGPGNLLSAGFPVQLVTGDVTTECSDPTISNILPVTGPVGSNKNTKVVILGCGFSVTPGVGNVTFVADFLSPTIQKINPSELGTSRLVVTAPNSATVSGLASVYVTNDDGKISNIVTFTYTSTNVNAPVITALSPSGGATSGETRVIVTGSNFTASDSIVFTGANITSDPGDICTGDGLPVCSNNQCLLSEARGTCVINGTSYDPFIFIGSGQFAIVTPNVGANAAGPADVLVLTTTGTTSNIVTYTYAAPANLRPPEITFIDPVGFSGDGCCGDSWDLLIFGNNFRRCSSVILRLGGIYEILPTPDVTDCGERRNAPDKLSPRERMQSILPPDGMTINCASRPDLVPLNSTGVGTYQHDQICYGGGAPSPYAAGRTATLVGTPPDDFTNGGAVQWVNDTTIRVLFGPQWRLPCSTSFAGSVYVSNDPGRGISGDSTSAPASLQFSNTEDCPTPTPAPNLTPPLNPASGPCAGGNSVIINGSGFIPGSTSVSFNFGNPATIQAISGTQIVVTAPSSALAGCVFDPLLFQCGVTVIVTVNGQQVFGTYTYQSGSTPGCT